MMDDPALMIPRGFRASGIKAGIKPSGGLDLAILAADVPCATAGTFTTNRICAAPVKWCRDLLPSDDVRAVVMNAGIANAATGAEGLANARRTAVKASGLLGCQPEQVLVASTGVIGHQLPMDRLEAGLEQAAVGLSADPESFRTAALSILTTDTRPKIVCERRTIDGREVRLLGIAKGAAMIGPRMATMLAFLMTDAPLWANALQDILADAVELILQLSDRRGTRQHQRHGPVALQHGLGRAHPRGRRRCGVRGDGPRSLPVARPADRR